MRKIFALTAYSLFIALLATAVVDYCIFMFRNRQGEAYGFVTVRQFIESPLKGSKEEYDYIGPVDKSCVRAILPHQKTQPCWWVRAHKDHWTRP